MFNLEKAFKNIKTIIDSIDFSKAKFYSKDSIDFTAFELDDLPSADFSEINSTISRVESNLDGWANSIQKSRMDENKKAIGLKRIDFIKTEIDDYKKVETVGDTEDKQYSKALCIKSKVIELTDYIPSSNKNNVKDIGKLLERNITKISSTIGDRRFFLNRFAERLIKRSEEYRINEQLDKLYKKGLTVRDIENAKSDDFLCAARKYASTFFGYGASDLISSVFYAKKLGNSLPEISWTYEDNIKNIVKFAQRLKLKEIAFRGESTSTLSYLNEITKIGLKFRIEEITRKTSYDHSVTEPVAIVSL